MLKNVTNSPVYYLLLMPFVNISQKKEIDFIFDSFKYC